MMIYVCQSMSMYVYVYDFQGSPKFFMAASPQVCSSYVASIMSTAWKAVDSKAARHMCSLLV